MSRGQHAFHFHLHIHPRYDNDRFNKEQGNKRASTLEERLPYIEKLKQALTRKKYNPL